LHIWLLDIYVLSDTIWCSLFFAPAFAFLCCLLTIYLICTMFCYVACALRARLLWSIVVSSGGERGAAAPPVAGAVIF